MEQNPLKKNKVGTFRSLVKFVYSNSVKVLDYFSFPYINNLDALIYLSHSLLIKVFSVYFLNLRENILLGHIPLFFMFEMKTITFNRIFGFEKMLNNG